MARKGNPISVRLDLNHSSDSSWFSDYYYGKSVYQDLNLRSYFGSIRPPTRLTFGFRLGRCIILHFPKRTILHFFLPRRPRRLKLRENKEEKTYCLRDLFLVKGSISSITSESNLFGLFIRIGSFLYILILYYIEFVFDFVAADEKIEGSNRLHIQVR